MSSTKQIGKEYPPEEEEQNILELGRILAKDQHVQPGKWRRGQHPKHHGCVRAKFTVADDLPGVLRHGIFKEPHVFNAYIRFSNGKSDDDRNMDVRGMAIKLLQVNGKKASVSEQFTQDFMTADNPVFFARNVRHLLDFVIARDSGKPIQEIAQNFPKLIGFSKLPPASPLETRYWSQTPYLLGNIAVKYSIKPSKANVSGKSPVDDANFLRAALKDWLVAKPAQFDFLVQLQTDPDAMPVEDPTVEWDETASPFIKVATIEIPAQTFDSPGQMAFCEALSYTPWHSLLEQRPLGGINRARRPIYEESSTLRHQKLEPSGEESF